MTKSHSVIRSLKMALIGSGSMTSKNPNGQTRVAFILAGNEQYGVRRLITSVVLAMDEAGVDCRCISFGSGEIVDDLRSHGARVEVLGLGHPPNFGYANGGKIRSLAGVLNFSVRAIAPLAAALKRADKPAAVVRMPNLVGIVGAAATIAKCKSAWLMPNLVSTDYPLDFNRRLYQLLFRATKLRAIANSKYTKTTLGRAGKKASVLYLGVRSAEFDPDLAGKVEVRERLDIPSSSTVLSVIARLREEKGHLQILEGIAKLGSTAENVHLLIVGGPLDSPYGRSVVHAIKSLGLADRVHMLGPQPNPLLYYAASDIVINWRLDPEPFGLSVVEAFMMRRPVLAHATGGPAETVVDGCSGWLERDESAKGFANVLARALADRDRWDQMGDWARENALERFETKAVSRNLLKILDDIDAR